MQRHVESCKGKWLCCEVKKKKLSANRCIHKPCNPEIVKAALVSREHLLFNEISIEHDRKKISVFTREGGDLRNTCCSI